MRKNYAAMILAGTAALSLLVHAGVTAGAAENRGRGNPVAEQATPSDAFRFDDRSVVDDLKVVSPQDIRRSTDGTVITVESTEISQDYAITDMKHNLQTNWKQGSGSIITFQGLDPHAEYEVVTREAEEEFEVDPRKPHFISTHTLPLYGSLHVDVFFDKETGGGQLRVDAAKGYGYALVTPDGKPFPESTMIIQGIAVTDSFGRELEREISGYYISPDDETLTFHVPAGGEYNMAMRIPDGEQYFDKDVKLSVPPEYHNLELYTASGRPAPFYEIVVEPANHYTEYAILDVDTGKLRYDWYRPKPNEKSFIFGWHFRVLNVKVIARPVSSPPSESVAPSGNEVAKAVLNSADPAAVGKAVLESADPSAVGRAILANADPAALEKAILESADPNAVGSAILKSSALGSADKAVSKSGAPGAVGRAVLDDGSDAAGKTVLISGASGDEGGAAPESTGPMNSRLSLSGLSWQKEDKEK